MFAIRHSKFKNIYGDPKKKDQCFDQIKLKVKGAEPPLAAVNPKYLAVLINCSTVDVMIRPLEEVGRVEADPKGIKAAISLPTCIEWCPRDDDLLFIGQLNGEINLIRIPDGGVSEVISTDDAELKWNCDCGSVLNAVWHPTVGNAVLTSCGSKFAGVGSSADTHLILWDTTTMDKLIDIKLNNCYLTSLSFNYNGSKVVCTDNSHITRIIDLRSTDSITQEAMLHKKARRQNTVYLKHGLIFSTGYSATTTREYALWDENDLSNPIELIDLDTNSGVLYPIYDADINVIYVWGKGDSTMSFFEVVYDPKPTIQYLCGYQSAKPQNGVIAMPKLGVNVAANELTRLFKFYANGFCEVIPVICPRREQGFSEEVYPPTPSRVPALSIEDWMSGIDVDPILISLETGEASTQSQNSNNNIQEQLDELNVSNKRKSQDSDDNAPTPKRQKVKSFNIEKDFCIYSTETLNMKLENFIEFPESLCKKIAAVDSYISNQKRYLKILISGPANCGKSTLIYHLAQEYKYRYVRVGKRYMENMDFDSFDRDIERLGEGFEKVLLHFEFNYYPTKISDNFRFKSDASSKFLMIFESSDPGSLVTNADWSIEFPIIDRLDREKYLRHFLFGNQDVNGEIWNCEEMARLTPGYEIGEIEALCTKLKKAYKTNPLIDIADEFKRIIESGEIKLIIKIDDIKWSDIGGHDEVKEQLKNIMNNVKNTEGFHKDNVVILYGPPGCGKTMLAKAIYNEDEFSFIAIYITDILSKYEGESEQKVRDAFNKARKNKPCILFIDAADALWSKRHDDNSGSLNSIVNTFLMELDGVAGHKNTQLLIIGATNFIERIDEAISRTCRMGRHIEINIPKSPEQRFSVLMAASKNGTNPKFGPCSLDEMNFSVENIFTQISSEDFTEDWSQADLAALIYDSYMEMKNDPNADGSNCVTMLHVQSAHRVRNGQKKINISPSWI